jgi:hypothetical protein
MMTEDDEWFQNAVQYTGLHPEATETDLILLRLNACRHYEEAEGPTDPYGPT